MKRIINDFKTYGNYVLYASKSQLKAEVADSKLNWVWWVLEPFCFMLIYSFVYGTLFGGTEKYHGLFIFVGLSIWQFFNKSVKHSVDIIRHKRAIIARVYIPKYLLVVQEILVDGFKLLICMIITVLMMIYYQVKPTPQIIQILPLFVIIALLTFGISCIVMHMGVFLNDMSNIMDIVLRMMVYFVGVFYSIPRRFPEPWNSLLVKWNPIALFVDSGRKILLYNETLNYKMLLFWGAIAVVIAYAGIQLIVKNENTYVKVV